MNARVPQNFGPISAKFAGMAKEDSLAAGVIVGYPILRIKGKAWSITRGGSEPHVLMRPDGDGPRNSLEVVVLQASQHVSKVWYENGYAEGSTAAPDCFSSNGVTPDPASKKKQCSSCAICPQNQWGARITPQGKPGKACSDSNRVAVAPLGDIRNEAFGGPMLLRVPAASLKDFANYGNQMQALGYHYTSIGTRMAFDAAEAFPKLKFEPVRPLTDEEADAVLELRASPAVKAILSEGSEIEHEPPAAAPTQLPVAFNQARKPVAAPIAAPVTPQVTSPASAPAPVAADGFGGIGPAATKPAPVAAPQPAPAPVMQAAPTTTPSSFEDELDAQLNALLPDVA